MVLRNTARQMAMDPARIRRHVGGGQQRNFQVWGLVGHTDALTGLPEPTPQYVRIEQGQIYVECTIVPDGDQIVARLGMDGAGVGLAEYFERLAHQNVIDAPGVDSDRNNRITEP